MADPSLAPATLSPPSTPAPAFLRGRESTGKASQHHPNQPSRKDRDKIDARAVQSLRGAGVHREQPHPVRWPLAPVRGGHWHLSLARTFGTHWRWPPEPSGWPRAPPGAVLGQWDPVCSEAQERVGQETARASQQLFFLFIPYPLEKRFRPEINPLLPYGELMIEPEIASPMVMPRGVLLWALVQTQPCSLFSSFIPQFDRNIQKFGEISSFHSEPVSQCRPKLSSCQRSHYLFRTF